MEMKKRVGPLAGARRVFLCCCGEANSTSRRCCSCRCITDSLDGISNTSRASKGDRTAGKMVAEKFADAVCLIQDSPFRILREQKNKLMESLS
ncbi:unnamed protein product [Orchesella dallaii]|uniref:Uncharacterized protein n=1 Tax=Orchesella dallaii TaxID=48710 RepID=A0ABP1PKV3_9HEXA